jgi:hypothetical protein
MSITEESEQLCANCKKSFIPTLVRPNLYAKNCEACREYVRNSKAKCLEECCKKFAAFGFLDVKKKLYCGEHSKDGMISLKNPICIHPDCKKAAYFNETGKGRALYCNNHKNPEDINTNKRFCIVEGCGKTCKFGDKDSKFLKYCGEHASDELKALKFGDNICKHPDCKKLGKYNFMGEKRGLYCFSHIPDKKMVNVKVKSCIFEDCFTKASYNIPSCKSPLYCKKHRDEKTMVNVTFQHCAEEGCYVKPQFNFEGNPILYCGVHKKEGMINVKMNRCLGENCNKIAICNYEGKTPGLYCTKHCLDGMIDVHNPRCLTEGCMQFAYMSKYCARCFYWNFPDHQKSKHIKLKENEVVKFIKLNFEDLNIIYDKQIIGDKLCINVRPDALIHLNEHSIIVEIDEHAHRRYDSQCEISRTHRIHEALNRNVIFIRFNPDNYIDKNKKQIPSCFVIDRAIGLTTIRKPQQKNWEHRLEILKKAIQKAIYKPPELPIEEVFLFYDGFDANIQKSKLTEIEE